MPELQFLKTLIFPTTLWRLQNWANFSIFSYLKFFLIFTILMAVLFSSVNKERFRDGSDELYRKSRLLLMLNLTK